MVELPRLSNTELIAGAAAVGGVAALGITAAVIARKHKSRKRKKAKNRSVRKRARRGKINGRRSRRTPRTAGKGKDRSHRRIRYTKNGQPYIIGAHGKARFIKRSSAKRSHSQKGGRY